MAEQENAENIVFLPWTVEQQPQPQTQALTLENPQQQKIYVDLAHSTDWVVAASIIVSGLISLFGFLVTVYIVKKSTESQIKSNTKIVESNNLARKIEIHSSFVKKAIDKIANDASQLILLLTDWTYKFGMIHENIINEKQKDISYQYENDMIVSVQLSELNEIFEKIRFNSFELSLFLNLLEIDSHLINEIDNIEKKIFTLVNDIDKVNSKEEVTEFFINSKKIKANLEKNLIDCMKKAA